MDLSFTTYVDDTAKLTLAATSVEIRNDMHFVRGSTMITDDLLRGRIQATWGDPNLDTTVHVVHGAGAEAQVLVRQF